MITILIGSALCQYISYISFMWFYIISGYLVIILLISAVIVIITFKFSTKLNIVTSNTTKAEKRLLYHTMFVTFWMILAQISNCVDVYFQSKWQESEWMHLALNYFTDGSYFISNCGSLIFLFCLSSTVRKEFYENFKFVGKCRPKRNKILNPMTIFTTS